MGATSNAWLRPCTIRPPQIPFSYPEPSTTLAYTANSPSGTSKAHRRRASSSGNSYVLAARQRTNTLADKDSRPDVAALQTIKDDVREPPDSSMSLSRTPSPQAAGGWATPGLATPTRDRSKAPKQYNINGTGQNVTWASAQARSAEVNGYAKTPSSGLGFLGRHMRKISASLPIFNHGGQDDRFAEKEKLGRGRWQVQGNGSFASVVHRVGRMVWRMRLRFILVIALAMALLVFMSSRRSCWNRPSRSPTDISSSSLLVPANFLARRWQQIRCHPRRKPRRWCHGMERPSRMGNRAR